MAAGYEPIDLTKKVHIEDTLVGELDDATIMLAKMRKCQPPKCRSKYRSITSNTVQYYSGVHVKAKSVKAFLSSSDLTDILNPELLEHDTFRKLNKLSKEITHCLAVRREIIKTFQEIRESQKMSDSTSHFKTRFLPLSSSHLYSSDFVVDEKCV